MRKVGKESLFDAIKSALIICIYIFLITFAFAYLLDVLLLSAAIPQFSEIFPSLEAELKEISLDDKASTRLSKILFSSCMLISYFFAIFIAYRARRKRREKFLSETKGLIPRWEGFIYHLKNHWLSETAVFIFNLLFYLFAGIFSPTYLFRLLFGKILALPLSIILILTAQVLGILSSQSRWRAIHFIGEE